MLLQIAYRYKGFDYLVADSTGNLYLIPHFRFRRTVYFKRIEPFRNGKTEIRTIKYHGSNVSFSQLKKKAFQAKETIEVY